MVFTQLCVHVQETMIQIDLNVVTRFKFFPTKVGDLQDKSRNYSSVESETIIFIYVSRIQMETTSLKKCI